MHITTLTNIDVFHLHDAIEQVDYRGFDQEWYTKKWHRMAGCGPTSASHIIFYLTQHQGVFGPTISWKKKADGVPLMDAMWNEVTPRMQGVNKTSILANGVQRYANKQGVDLWARELEIPKKASLRPTLAEVATFIDNGLANDIPMAFLNKHQGDCSNLEGWHWVTIIGCQWDKESNTLSITTLDGGQFLTIDLALWLATTKLGGGFVSFELSK